MVSCHVFLSNISLVSIFLAILIGSKFRKLSLPWFFLLHLYGSLCSPFPHISDLILSKCIIIIEVFRDEWSRLKHKIESLISGLALSRSTGSRPFSALLISIDRCSLWICSLSYSDTSLHPGRSHRGTGSWDDIDASLRDTQLFRHLFDYLVDFGISLAVVYHWALGLCYWLLYTKETVIEPRIWLQNACNRILQTKRQCVLYCIRFPLFVDLLQSNCLINLLPNVLHLGKWNWNGFLNKQVDVHAIWMS